MRLLLSSCLTTTLVVCFCAHSQNHVTVSSDRLMAQEQKPSAFIHHISINLVAEPMEPIHAEILRLVAELEAVQDQVHTECSALRDFFARTTAAMSSSVPQHDWRLHHKEAGRHLPEQFVGSRFDHGDIAFRMEGCEAVLSLGGQGGALLREVAKLENFANNTSETLGRTFLDVQQLGETMAASLITCTRGEVATLVNLVRSHTFVQTQISGGRSGVDGEAHITKANQQRE